MRLPVSLILITICILTPFTVLWSPTITLSEDFENTTTTNPDILLTASNLSFAQNRFNEVRFFFVFYSTFSLCQSVFIEIIYENSSIVQFLILT